MADAHDLAHHRGRLRGYGRDYRRREAWAPSATSGTFAFYPNKQMTTGEGGMLVTDDGQIAELAYSMRNQGRGRKGTWLEHERLGYNYRLDEMSAALGLSQLSRIDAILRHRAEVAGWYNDAMKGLTGAKALESIPGTARSWFVYVVLLDKSHTRGEVMERLETWGVENRAYFPPIHLQPLYRDLFGYRPGDFPVCEDVASRTLALPFHNALTKQDCENIVEQLARAIK